MRAWRVTAHGEPRTVLRLEEGLTVPEPRADQVRIRVGAVALNFGDDLLCRGQYQLRPELPFTPGLEVAGEVVAAGAEAGIELGARVIGVPDLPNGGLAEQCLADARKRPLQGVNLTPIFTRQPQSRWRRDMCATSTGLFL